MKDKKRILFALCISISSITMAVFSQAPPGAKDRKEAIQNNGDELIAIDVLLEPDETLIRKSRAVGALLQQRLQSGPELVASHPHITLLQRFVRAKDLDAVAAALAKVLIAKRLENLRLKTKDYGYESWEGGAVTIIAVERTPELMRLHRMVVDAVEPFSVNGGTAAAFAARKIDPVTISYVETFVPESSGDNYAPQVVAGIAGEGFAKRVKAEPYHPFTFKADGVAVYQLGKFGVAAKKLWSWTPMNDRPNSFRQISGARGSSRDSG